MNVGHTIPTLVEAFIYIAVVNVDLKTLVLMIAASVAGAWFGAGIVADGRAARFRSEWGWRYW